MLRLRLRLPAALVAASVLLAPSNPRAQQPTEATAKPRPAEAANASASPPANASSSGSTSPAVRVTRPLVLPEAITSFGACASGGWLYVYGGHVGREHQHSRDNVRGTFVRLDLVKGTAWEKLPDGEALQGTSLVAAADGSLYRVGGMNARNAKGEDGDLHSTASVARFDPANGAWREATPLPEPRSSHDAIVLGNDLYVIGGWTLQGAGDGKWLDTAWVADLREEPLVWKALPSPGHVRRACAVATFANKIAVLGGIDSDGTIATVRVYDPATRAWSEGPDLPGFAFGTAALGVGDVLYATVLDGGLVSWNGTGGWQTVAQFETPRFFHRLLPAAEPGSLVALGGAGRGGHLATMETLRLERAANEIEVREFTMAAPSRVAHRQALLLRDNVIWAFGGNRALEGDRFAPQQFANDVWRIELATMKASKAGELPNGCQSMAAVAWGKSGDNLVVGGLGVAADTVASVATGFQWDSKRAAVKPFAASLPAARTQHAVVAHGERLYVLGGTDFTPDADGGSTKGDYRDVLVCEPKAEPPAFAASGIQLPRERRSFGTAVLGDELYLIGGLGDGFDHAGPCDVYDFAKGEWRQLEAPVAWVSPEVAVIGKRLYVACGGTMQGQRFTEDKALWSYSPAEGWRRVVAELPFRVRHVQMLPLRNRLLFYTANEAPGERVTVRLLEPDADVAVAEPRLHR